MRKLKTVLLFSGLLLFFTASAMAQSPISVTAPIGVKTFVAHLVLPPNVVRANAVMGLTRQANWVDAPAKWEWEKVHDSAGFVKSIIVYVTLDPDNTTQAYGKTDLLLDLRRDLSCGDRRKRSAVHVPSLRDGAVNGAPAPANSVGHPARAQDTRPTKLVQDRWNGRGENALPKPSECTIRHREF